MYCDPIEGYIAIRRNPETKESDTSSHYTFIKKDGTDNELWMVCMRGERLGEALRFSEVNEEEWLINELDGWSDIIEGYYADFGGYGKSKIGPVSAEYLIDEITTRVKSSIDNEIEPTIKMVQMKREDFLRQSDQWNSVCDKLREDPEAYMEKFLQSDWIMKQNGK